MKCSCLPPSTNFPASIRPSGPGLTGSEEGKGSKKTCGRTTSPQGAGGSFFVAPLPPFLSHLQSSSPALRIPRGLMLPSGSLNTPILVASSNLSPTKKSKLQMKDQSGYWNTCKLKVTMKHLSMNILEEGATNIIRAAC